MVSSPLIGEELARWEGFNAEDFLYFTRLYEANAQRGGAAERSLRAHARTLHTRLRQLATLLEPPLPNLVLDVTRPHFGRLPAHLSVAFHRPEAGRKKNDANLFLMLSADGLQVGFGWGRNQHHPVAVQALATFYERMQAEPEAHTLLQGLLNNGYLLLHRPDTRSTTPAEWLKRRPGTVVYTIEPEGVIHRSRTGDLAEEVLSRLHQLLPLYNYIYPVGSDRSTNSSPVPVLLRERESGYNTAPVPLPEASDEPAGIEFEVPGLKINKAEPQPLNLEPDTQNSELYAPDPTMLLGTLHLPINITDQLITLINLGRHVILSGPPGTGKTTLAVNAAQAAVHARFCDGFLTTTATADWTTFDTIGGYTPGADGRLQFREGFFLQSLRENRWAIIDEINRADIDKAFGQLLTVLSGQDVELPFSDSHGRRYRIVQSVGLASRFVPAQATYELGRNWRILATMNTFDKNALFTMSYAFMRRFAFVQITNPDVATFQNWIDSASISAEDRVRMVTLLRECPRPLGPAIMQDMLIYIAARPDPAAFYEALVAYVLPQLEGLPPREVEQLYTRIIPLLDPDLRGSFRDHLIALFAIDPARLTRNTRQAQNQEEDEGP